VIPKVANFIEEGLVIPEGWDWVRKRIFENLLVRSYRELNPGRLREMQESWPLHQPDIVMLQIWLYQRLLWNKKSNFTNPPQTQIDMIDIGHKSLPIIIGPYWWRHLLMACLLQRWLGYVICPLLLYWDNFPPIGKSGILHPKFFKKLI
jgi:hypothetical protein